MTTSAPSSRCAYYLALTLIPALSLLYVVALLAFRAASFECAWSDMNGAILARSAVLVVAVAVAVGLDESESSLSPASSWASLVAASVVANVAAVAAIRRARAAYALGPRPDLPHDAMRGRTVLVTGANAGIGLETARRLLDLGATVVFACRSEERANKAIDDAVASSDDADDARARARFLPLDLSDLSSVRRAAKLYKEQYQKEDGLHVLVLNAGIMMRERRVTESDGHELTMQCNHLGHFLLTHLLTPELVKAASPERRARVVVVSSCTHKGSKRLVVEDLFCEQRSYTIFGQYSQTKLANVLFARELARRYEEASQNISSYVLHPGLVATDVVRNLPRWMVVGNILFGPFTIRPLQKHPAAGAYTSVYCAASDKVEGVTGKYYVNSAEQELHAGGQDDETAKKLWELSCQLVGVS